MSPKKISNKPKALKKTRKHSEPKPLQTGLYVVGIGASAGGLEALKELITSLKPSPKLTYVVAQHLSPTHTSMLKTLLAKDSNLAVVDLSESQVPEASTIYITPPSKDVIVQNGTLKLLPSKLEIGPKPSINRFFASLAEDQGERAIGIILSGTGADGASGLLAIKSSGGISIVQNPDSAKYDGMPLAAIQTGKVDLILKPSQIGAALDAFVSAGSLIGLNTEQGDNLEVYDNIIALARDVSGVDLTQYKSTTIERRINRRIALHRHKGMEQFYEHLLENDEEIKLFVQDVLISVTEFFRDKEAFSNLNETITKIVETSTPSNDTIRCWVPGCATGEEAFSIAMQFEEVIRKCDSKKRYQIFATDIDPQATAKARNARYPEAAFETMDQDLRNRYFEQSGAEWIAKKFIRENIVFSNHNLIQDPPFSRVDLVSCRNLLIYFRPALQKRVLEIFHYALNLDGFLFLGKSETVNQHDDLFAPVNKKARIYRKLGDQRVFRPYNLSPEIHSKDTVYVRRNNKPEINPVEQNLKNVLVDSYSPPAAVVSGSDEVIHTHGNISPFLKIGNGPTNLNVFELISESLRAELRALIYKARRESKTAVGGKQNHGTNGESDYFRIIAHPMNTESTGIIVVVFETINHVNIPDVYKHDDSDLVHSTVVLELEHELATTREHLQTVVEELETSNEELQSVNEELQSANEELQSTNEELQTANEELQSTNEELLTVNDELQVKSHEIEVLATDLENIQDSVSFPIIVVDKNARIQRFVPAADQIIPISEMHLNDTITAVPWRTDVPQLRNKINSVIKTGKTLQTPVPIDEKIFQMWIAPYRDKSQEIVGAVLLFPDTTELHNIKSSLESSEKRLQIIINHIVDGVVTIDESGKILSFSEAAERIFEYKANEVIGKNVKLIMPTSYAKKHDNHLKQYMETGQAKAMGKQREVVGKRKSGEHFPLELSVEEMQFGNQRIFTGLLRDITDRRNAEDALFREKERAEVTLHSIGDAVITVDLYGNIEYLNPVAERLTGWKNYEANGESAGSIFKLIDETTRDYIQNPVYTTLEEGKSIRINSDLLLRNRHGDEFSIEQSCAPIRNSVGKVVGVVMVFHDVTDKHNMMRQMAWQARHDPLTGLVNRKEFETRIERALTSAKSFKREHALLYLDLDQFKVINDTGGHRAGDEFLRQISGHISNQLRDRDALSRLGGDEFGILLENCSLNQGHVIAEKIKETVQEFRYIWDDKIFKVGASIGLVEINENSTSIAELLSDADAACYAAKENGRNRVQAHTPNDSELLSQRKQMIWVSNINQVLDEDRFRLYLQQIKPLGNDRSNHFEVLLRMIDGNGDIVLPGVFLPAAERYGLMHSIDRWVVSKTLSILETHNKQNSMEEQMNVAINLSGVSIGDSSFLSYVKDQIAQHKILPKQVCFELTETTAIANFSKAVEFMRELKKTGCHFALDDFGSGMSSFGYLKSLPVDYLKVDGAFVKDMAHDVVDLAMVESINRIGHLMDISTIAEYVESEEILSILDRIGLDYVQGFGVHKPAPVEDFLKTPATTN